MTFKTRHFNNIEYVHGIHALKKVSLNIEKIKAEYDYYYKLPPHLQRYFVQPFHFEIDDAGASYYTEKYNIEDLAKQFINNKISEQSFLNFTEKIKRFQWESGGDEVSAEEIYSEAKSIIIEKNIYRSSLLESNKIWKESEYRYALAANNITTDNLLSRLDLAFNQNIKNRKTSIIKISHGDLCFSNILWDNDLNIIKFIDPKGWPHFIMDEYYDISKLSHSLLGRYDDIVYEKYNVDFEKNNIEFINTPPEYLNEIFLSYLNDKQIDYSLLRIFEASIFLSMTPMHIDDDKRVAVFLMNCDRILRGVGF